MADSTLNAIRIKVRRLTRSMNESLLSTVELDNYINTFVQYDFPEHLRTFTLRTTLTFFTDPFVDVYETNTVDPANPLYQFKQKYLSVHEPIYIAGRQVLYSQSREQFFGIYPQINFIAQVGSGDGVATIFAGTVPSRPILRNNVLFNSITATGAGLELNDDGQGNLTGDGIGTIDYVTGAFILQFNIAPAAGSIINSQTVPYVASLPQALLFYDSKFTVRPVPDQVYRINMEVYIRPTELLAANQSPELEEWWQYIAYGSSKKIFEDRMDMESVQMIMPEFMKQQSMMIRRTIMQNSNERVATIYTEQSSFGPGSGSWGWGGGPF